MSSAYTKRIKTNLKFYTGLGSGQRLYALVTKQGSSWRGCSPADTCKKKIVFPDAELELALSPNVLYKCSLVPMRSGDGYIALCAHPVLFEGLIETQFDKEKGSCTVTLRFGNHKITYNPNGPTRKSRDIKGMAEWIRGRMDLKNSAAVAEDFISSAVMAKSLSERERAKNSTNKNQNKRK